MCGQKILGDSIYGHLYLNIKMNKRVDFIDMEKGVGILSKILFGIG